VESSFVDELVQLGILTPDENQSLGEGDVRRTTIVHGLAQAGLPVTGVADLIRQRVMALDFVDAPSFGVFAALAPLTFRELSEQTGLPVDLLLEIRDAMGSAHPQPDDRVRESELEVVPSVQAMFAVSARAAPVERVLRVLGDSLRRIAETEADWWANEIQEPLFRSGKPPEELSATIRRHAEIQSAVTGRALMGVYHGQQSSAWMKNMLEGIEGQLARAGLYSSMAHPPAICFLDLSGYTRVTDERGDEAAAELAGVLNRLVQQTSAPYGGKAVKWLGDGVMFWFREPGQGVAAALDMVDGARSAGLPPAHVGLHAGPVLFQEGDYFGRTVNVAARIADYARQGEVLVSQDVVEAAASARVAFEEIGPVELKGISDPVRLSVARRPA